MIKRIIKILATIFLILALIILYLSIFGIKTNKFNEQITNNILKINKKINLNLKDVKYLLNPYNFTIDIKTKNPQISLEGRKFEIKDIQTNIALKSLINDQFSIEYLQFKTKEIKLNDIIALGRAFHNSPQLYLLNKVIKDGFITANVSLNFDERGKIKENYKIEGSIKEAKLNILNQIKLQNLNLKFYIDHSIYSLKKIETKLNNIKITSPLIEITEKKNSFFVNGQFINEKKSFNIEELKTIFVNLPNYINIKKVEFSSKNDFSFNIGKNLKFDNFKIKSNVDLKELIFNKKNLKLKPYLPSFIEDIKLTENKIIINYYKKNFDIKGNGNVLLEGKSDKISYQIKKDKNDLLFNSKVKLKSNALQIDFLYY